MSTIETIANAIPSGLSLTEDEKLGVIEITYLAVAADRVVNSDEEDALQRIGARVMGAAAHDVIAGLVATPPGTREEATERLRAAAARLTGKAAREAAYKGAYAAAMADLASSDEEFEFDLDLVVALGLTQDDADRLAGEVIEALQPAG